MPTYRKRHLPTCPVWPIENAAHVQHELKEPVTVRTSNLSSIDRARLLAGLSDLSQAFVKGEQGRYGMRIPAEPYHDGDLVCGGAMRLIVKQNAEIERLLAALTEYIECYGRPRNDEWVDGGPSFDRATKAWHEALALLGKSPDETPGEHS